MKLKQSKSRIKTPRRESIDSGLDLPKAQAPRATIPWRFGTDG